LVGIFGLVPTLYVVLFACGNSSADPPWIAALVGKALLIVGLILDFISSRKKLN